MTIRARLSDRIDALNAAQRIALTIGVVLAIVMLAAALQPRGFPRAGWYGYAANTYDPSARPVLWGRLTIYRPWMSTVWWLATDAVATAVAVRLLRTPPPSTRKSP